MNIAYISKNKIYIFKNITYIYKNISYICRLVRQLSGFSPASLHFRPVSPTGLPDNTETFPGTGKEVRTK